MLSLFRRKPQPAIEVEAIREPVAEIEDIAVELAEPADSSNHVRRMKQQNIKASDDCSALFAALAKALGMTKAELFEDMVAERYETLRRQGVELEVSAG
jgi:hypothetical protein